MELLNGEKPRDVILEKGAEALDDKALLSLIIQTGTRYKSVEEISEQVLEYVDKNIKIQIPELLLIAGLGEARAASIAAALELGRRRNLRKSSKIKTPQDAYEEVKHYASRSQEHLIVIALNGAHEVIYTEVVTIGLVNMTVVHPREVFANAIKNRATGIILSHNHPSGIHEEASQEDITITKRIRNAGMILGIGLIDHIIISENGYMSFKEKGLL